MGGKWSAGATLCLLSVKRTPAGAPPTGGSPAESEHRSTSDQNKNSDTQRRVRRSAGRVQSWFLPASLKRFYLNSLKQKLLMSF